MKITLKLSDTLYYLSYFIWLFFIFISQTSLVNKFPVIYKLRILAMVVSIILLFVKFLCEKHTIEFILTYFGALCLGIAIGITVHKPYYALMVISTILLIVSIKNVNFRNVLILWSSSIALFMFLIFGLVKLNLIENSLRIQSGGRVRFSQGYFYVSFGANYLFHLTLVYLYIRLSKIKFWEILGLGLLNYYFYINTDTKSAFYSAILSLVLVYLFRNKTLSPKLLSIMGRFVLTVGVLLPIALTYFYNGSSKFFHTLNIFLTGRLSLGHKAWSLFGVHLFGQRIDWALQQSATSVFDDYLYVDSSFVNILLHYGVILLIIIWFSYYQLIKREYFNTIEMLVFVVLIIHSMFDPQFFELMYNPLLLLIGVSWTMDRHKYQEGLN